MPISWSKFCSGCKSRVSALARSCFLGRHRWREKYSQELTQLQEQVSGLEQQVGQQQAKIAELQAECDAANQRAKSAESQLAESQGGGVRLPDDPRIAGQHYGARTIMLSINLMRKLGLRKTVSAMEVFFQWLGVEFEIPSYQAIRGWTQRVGLDRIEHVPKKTDWLWMVDQSNQIGELKCLMVLGIQKSKLPPAGTPLRKSDMRALAVLPAKTWNRETVATVYQSLSERYGVPKAVLSDGAVELREPVKSLKNKGKSVRSFRDTKHFLANRLESLLSGNEQFQAFTTRLGQVRSSMQQTELAHLAPPVMRQKARFMDLAPLLKWSQMALWHFDHPDSEGCRGINRKRLDEQLGWLAEYRGEIGQWSQLLLVIGQTLKSINADGLTGKTKRTLRRGLKRLATTAVTTKFIRQVLAFIGQQASKLVRGERLPLSTEIVESSLAVFKGLEQRHARSGFTPLLLAFPCLLKPTTVGEVQRALVRTKVQDIKNWTAKHLPVSVDARRQAAYRESRGSQSKATTKLCATALPATS